MHQKSVGDVYVALGRLSEAQASYQTARDAGFYERPHCKMKLDDIALKDS